ncbi:MAG: hypothetical protein IPJ87_07320 [Flavobacteriales bacterium]|jgi:hypothetical protein|nr:hypothetical protein [Flavobacteriales bacterium]MBK7941670.1 hypothetical protein [Flavobacteriales bacterium]MBK8949303.1 hypothetical protein [Flavobacteriales bacterium]MBK9700213.1 hypothetical protein [Flavobacteriales bacterium]
MKERLISGNALIATVLLFGCGDGKVLEHQHDGTAHDSSTAAVDSLRWQANPETTEGIRSMQALVEGLSRNGLSGIQLRDSLDARLAMIFERCTMDGEAHEALHAYLLPLMGMIKRLPDTPSEAHVDSLRTHLHHYGEVFY